MEKLVAFDLVKNIFWEEIEKQGFSAAENYDDEKGNSVIYKTDTSAYSILFDDKKKCFELRSGTLDEEGKVDTWKNLSQWLFDVDMDGKTEATSIGNDFADIASGPKMVADIKSITKPKKKKNEEGNIDALFFFNRLVNVFPELKDAINQERIIFGKVRFATMTKEVIVPKCEALAVSKESGFDRLCDIFNDMYKDGDIEVRGMIIHGIFNSLSDTAMTNISEKFSDELKKIYACSRKLKNKHIKPNKPKKKNKVVAAALENANKNSGK